MPLLQGDTGLGNARASFCFFDFVKKEKRHMRFIR